MGRSTFSGPVRSIAGFIFGEGPAITKALKAAATLDFGSITNATSADLTVAVTGAAVGDPVILGLPAAMVTGLVFNAFVSAANVVTVRASNITAAPINPASGSFTVIVLS